MNLQSDQTAFSGQRERSGEVKPYQIIEFLESESGRRIYLTLTRNRSSYVSFGETRPGGAVKLRLQRAFLGAPGEVLRPLARWVGRMRGACPAAVRRFIDAHVESDPRPRRRAPVRIRTKGSFHDLAAMAAKVNRECFMGRLEIKVSWGRAGSIRRRVRQRQLGSYDRERNLVVISPILDQEDVPAFFVEFVIFHEMLHAVQPPGAKRDHDREFCRVERMHPCYRRAAVWQRRNLSILLNPPGTRRRVAARPVRQGLLF